MFASIPTLQLNGLSAQPLVVEADLASGLPAFDLVGLGSTAVKEAKERVRSAIRNSGFRFPGQRITVNLAPADVRKEGSGMDLPIAVAIMLAAELAPSPERKTYIIGELSLEGNTRPISGILPLITELASLDPEAAFIIPSDNLKEASLAGFPHVWGARNLIEIVQFLRGEGSLQQVDLSHPPVALEPEYEDLADVRGQAQAKRALTIAAAGQHNILLIGPPGTGKTMLARRLPGLLPSLTHQEMLEITRVYSAAGLLPPETPVITARPFRAPHKTASVASIVGGGRIPRPGEISLALHGVLFLDELPEFNRDVIEALRQPLEDGVITVARAQATLTYPADFLLICAMNPCPCGFFGDPSRECRCGPVKVRQYLTRLSGPLLDRLDLHVELPREDFTETAREEAAVDSVAVRALVTRAREAQSERYKGEPFALNSGLTSRTLRKYCQLSREARGLLLHAVKGLSLSARAHDRVLKVARTIADLNGCEHIEAEHIAEAISFRSLDRKYWN